MRGDELPLFSTKKLKSKYIWHVLVSRSREILLWNSYRFIQMGFSIVRNCEDETEE